MQLIILKSRVRILPLAPLDMKHKKYKVFYEFNNAKYEILSVTNTFWLFTSSIRRLNTQLIILNQGFETCHWNQERENGGKVKFYENLIKYRTSFLSVTNTFWLFRR